jgi:DNA-binding NarL/FixJ family response regulator
MTGGRGTATLFTLKMNSNAESIEMTQTVPEDSQAIPTIVVSRPGIMQQSLRSSLGTCDRIAVIASSGDGLTALCQVRKHHPGMLVIDSNLLDEEVEALIHATKSEQPAIRCLVFVRSSQHETRMLAAGADAVALRNASSQQLQAVLLRLADEAREFSYEIAEVEGHEVCS